jgi:DNA-binding NarL/FixJ family response regulator
MQAQPTTPIKVFLIDCQKIVLAGLKLLLQTQPRFVVCGSATGQAEAMQQLTQQQPDVIVLELDLAEENGLYLIPQLHKTCPAKLLVLTANTDLSLHDQAVITGARGVVSKNELPQTLFTAIERIHQGELWLNRDATARILLGVARAHTPRGSTAEDQLLASLTKKEEKVLQAVATSSGKQLKVIADEMCISQHTLRNHLASIYDKLGVANRLELYVFFSANHREVSA